MAVENFYQDLIFMEKKAVADGYGGFVVSYKEGIEFKGAVTTNSTIETRIAEQQGFAGVYTVTTGKNTMLDFHDVIKVKKDGRLVRITAAATEIQTPDMATFNFWQVSGERFEINE